VCVGATENAGVEKSARFCRGGNAGAEKSGKIDTDAECYAGVCREKNG